MLGPNLVITYRGGKVLAAYYHLRRESGDKARAEVEVSRPFEPGLVVDFDGQGTPVGVEIVDPGRLTAEEFNRTLLALGVPPVDPAELAPLHAA